MFVGKEKLKIRLKGGEKVDRPLAHDEGKLSKERNVKRLVSLFRSFPQKNEPSRTNILKRR